MLHAAPHFRLLAVVLLLLVSQRMTLLAFLADYRSHVLRFHHIFHPTISRVEPCRFSVGLLGRLCQYARRLLGVVAIGCTHRVVLYELGLVAYLHVVLVPVEPLATFLHPPGIYVLPVVADVWFPLAVTQLGWTANPAQREIICKISLSNYLFQYIVARRIENPYTQWVWIANPDQRHGTEHPLGRESRPAARSRTSAGSGI